jgi:hypothetical protein
VEAARPQWNKVLQALFHLAVTSSGVGGRPVRWELFGSEDQVGALDLDGSCTAVEPDPVLCFIQVWCKVEVVGFVDVWWVDLLFFLVGLR